MNPKTLDAKAFDAGEAVGKHIDWSTARRPCLEKRRVDIDFTDDMEAQRRGVTRQALIKMWTADRLEQAA